jgi:hypothetical protein
MKEEPKIIQVRKILEKGNLPFSLMASTLLGIYRDGEPIGNYEFALRARDVNAEKMEKLKDLVNYGIRTSDSGIAIIDLPGFSENNNNLELHLIYFKNDYAYHNLSGDDCLVWPRKIWEKWDKINWRGLEWNTPSDVEKYLEIYYGKTWREPRSFSWHTAPNHFKLTEVKNNLIDFL